MESYSRQITASGFETVFGCFQEQHFMDKQHQVSLGNATKELEERVLFLLGRATRKAVGFQHLPALFLATLPDGIVCACLFGFCIFVSFLIDPPHTKGSTS